jgi:pimeloyl-ACP methyl ester carboxylesterase
MTSTHSLDLPGVHLQYQVRGAGPLLLVMGAPIAAAALAPLADSLASDHTVVTHDPRDVSGYIFGDPVPLAAPEQRADDVAALLDALDAESADVFGAGGGAVTGIALVTRHPGRVRTLVVQEPPLLELLPDAAGRRAEVDDVVETFHRDGPEAAWQRFMASSGFDPADEDAPATQTGRSARYLVDGARFFGRGLEGAASYLPDIAALTASRTDVVVGISATSGDSTIYQTSAAFAELLGTRMVRFPGGHHSVVDQPDELAAMLRRLLAGRAMRKLRTDSRASGLPSGDCPHYTANDLRHLLRGPDWLAATLE